MDLAIASGWPLLPDAKELGGDIIPNNIMVSGQEYKVAGCRLRYAFFPEDDERCVVTVSFPGFDFNGSFEAGVEGLLFTATYGRSEEYPRGVAVFFVSDTLGLPAVVVSHREEVGEMDRVSIRVDRSRPWYVSVYQNVVD
jgi:hypothetical protein